MKIAVVAGGWHFPGHFYREMAEQTVRADLFVVAHRSPDLPVVREEKLEVLAHSKGPLADLDRREMYSYFPSALQLCNSGWNYQEAPNTVGDWGFFNQWLETHDYQEYDVILNCHDDTYIRSRELLNLVKGHFLYHKWLLLSNGRYPEAPEGYVRGSFEFWSREMLDLLGGRIDLGKVTLTREGKTDTPVGMKALDPWNYTGVPLRNFIVKHGLVKRVMSLSPHYRVSPWVIEGERGFLNKREGAPWSFEAGLREYAPELL